MTLLVLGLLAVALMLVTGSVAVTAAQLARMRLLDAADSAALAAANALDASAYPGGIDDVVPLTDATVSASAWAYLASVPRPTGVSGWQVDPGTGSPDGRTAVVRLSCRAELPMVGPVLDALGRSVTIRVVSRARAEVEPP